MIDFKIIFVAYAQTIEIMKNTIKLICLLFFSTLVFAQERPPEKFDIQGHRGARGLYPENSIAGFIHAIDLGVTTLEMDVVITKDNEVILSHEPFMSHLICVDENGNVIEEAEEKSLNIYEMDYDEVKTYDCGSIEHPWFPAQKKMEVEKPLLFDVIDKVETYIEENKLDPVNYNIETKITPEGDNIYHPEPEEFVKLVMEVIEGFDIEERVIIQSFDVRTLQQVEDEYPYIQTALLVGEDQSVTKQIKELGFRPDILSPHFSHVNNEMIIEMQGDGVTIIPWTVNEQEDMMRLIEMGLDAIITDYPDRLVKVVDEMR